MTKKIKLLLIVDEMEVGGTQRQIVNLLCNIDKSRFDVQLLYFVNDSYLIDELEKSGVVVKQIPKTKKLDASFFVSLVRHIKHHQFDIVHSFSISAEFWTMFALLFINKTKFLSSIRGVYEWYDFKHWLAKSLISNRSSAIISNSQSGKQYAVDKQVLPSVEIDVIHNGVNTPVKVKDYHSKEEGVLKCLVLGRLIQGKNIRLLLDAAKYLHDSGTIIKIEVAGSGPDKEALENHAFNLGIDSECISFLGEVDNVPDLLMRNDVLVQPSLREGLSNSILEAMFAGLPVIASNADGNLELVNDSVTGYLFNNNDLNSLIEKLVYVNENYDKAIKCASTVKKWVDTEFSITTMCNKFENKYLEVFNEC